MKIGVIQASSQIEKNELIYRAAKEYAKGHAVVNYGCTISDKEKYSYIEISILIGLLLSSGTVDFVVTGCSSGQGMMLACNSMPGVICGYAPTPKDAYLYAQINHGNAISLPLGEDYTYTGETNCVQTIKLLFSEPFGQGYPKSEAARKLEDTRLLKWIRKQAQIDMVSLLEGLDIKLIDKVFRKSNVIEDILEHGDNRELTGWIRRHL